MKIVDFTSAHIEQAINIIKCNYEDECKFVPDLPPIENIPDLNPLAENNLGVAAIENGNLIGFLCGRGVWNNAWSIANLRNVFSPMHANGTVADNRAEIYAKLYQAAGKKWANVGAASHAVCLYAHDNVGQMQFFRYGFGMRCIDAIRATDEITPPHCNGGYTFDELPLDKLREVYPLERLLDIGYIESPFFMYREPDTEDEFFKQAEHYKSIYFIARYHGQAVAFIRAELDGETFIQNTKGYLHCKGLYCLPEHRGKGISQNLLKLLIQKLRTQDYTRLGVDFESINPSGSGFWLKYFTAYTHGLVRRIDETVLK